MTSDNEAVSFLKSGSILEGPFWSERIKAIASKQIGAGVEVQGIGVKSERFYSRLLRKSDMVALSSTQLFSELGTEPLTRYKPQIKLAF